MLMTQHSVVAAMSAPAVVFVFHAAPHHMDRARKTVIQMRMMVRGLMP